MKHKSALYGVLAGAIIVCMNMSASAESTQFKQKILPIDCVYEVVDAGTQRLRYLTPATCPVDPGPPVVTEPANPTESFNQDEIGLENYSYPLVIAKPPLAQGNQQSTNSGNRIPLDSSAEIKGRIERILQTNDSKIAITATAIMIIAGTLLIIVRKRRVNDGDRHGV